VPSSRTKEYALPGFTVGKTLSGFHLSSITSIQRARIWERDEIIRGRAGVNKPSHTHTCNICQGELPCWEKDCPIAERFICDDCADDALDQTGSPATR
jgi:hypothetical protein